MRKQTWQWLGFACIGLLIGGCGEMENPFDSPYQPPSIKALTKKPLTVKRQPINMVYVPINKRDPFRSPHQKITVPVEDNRVDVPAPPKVKIVPKTELELFQLDQLRLVATITGVANPIAMIELPDGYGYKARKGTLLGKERWRIVKIHPKGITVEVNKRDALRNVVTRRHIMMTKKEWKLPRRGELKIGNRQIKLR